MNTRGFWKFEDHYEYFRTHNAIRPEWKDRDSYTINVTCNALGINPETGVKSVGKQANRRSASNALAVHWWMKNGHPYVKVAANRAVAMARTKLNIPGSQVHLPFPAFSIDLPTSRDNPMQEPGGMPLRSILVHQTFDVGTMNELAKPIKGDRYMYVTLDFGESEVQDGFHFRYYQSFGLDLDCPKSIHDVFTDGVMRAKALDHEPGGYAPSADLIHGALALAVCATFFLNNDRQDVTRDIAPRDASRWKRLMERRAGMAHIEPPDIREEKRIIEKSKELGYGGYVLREISLPRAASRPTFGHGGEPHKTHELQWQHARGGHGAWRWIGPRTNPDLKWVFIEPTTVKPDLPVNPNQVRGYRIA